MKFQKRTARKLGRIILLDFGLVTFRIHLRKPENSSFSWFSDFRTCPWLPKPIILDFGDTKILWKIRETIPNPFWEMLCWETSFVWKSNNLLLLEKWRSKKSEDPSKIVFENLEYGINIFQKTWNGHLVIWDHYLRTNIEYFESLKLSNSEPLKFNFEFLKFLKFSRLNAHGLWARKVWR